MHALGEEAGADQPAKKSRTVKYETSEELAKTIDTAADLTELGGRAEHFAIRT